MDGLRGAGWTPPEHGRILMSVADSEKSESMPVASQFISIGWQVDATTGTAAYLKKWGIIAETVPIGQIVKKLRAGEWNMVLNIPGGNERHISEGAEIRHSAAMAGVPCLHSMPAAWAVVRALGRKNN